MIRRSSLRITPWIVLGTGGGLGSMVVGVIGMLFLLAVVASVLSPLVEVTLPFSTGASQTTTGTFVSNGSIPVGVTHEWQGPRNQSVLNAALYVASGLYCLRTPCGGSDDNYDTWYDEAKIPQAIAFWQQDCPGCASWAQGNVQCVMLVTAAYGLAGQELPYVSNAIDFWTNGQYNERPGWETLPPSALPYPGDMVVFDSPFFGHVGHIAIVVDVKLPDARGQGGYVQFAEANGPGAIVQMPLNRAATGGFVMGIWTDYTVEGYIRHPGVNNEFLVFPK